MRAKKLRSVGTTVKANWPEVLGSSIEKTLKQPLKDIWNCSSKISPDMFGGLLLVVMSLFWTLSIYEAYQAGNIVGVSLAWSLFATLVNGVYICIFGHQGLKWSMIGSVFLFFTDLIYTCQIIYYQNLLGV